MVKKHSSLRPLTAALRARDGPLSWFLDLDGTLVEIAPRPEAVTVPPTLPDLLKALHCPPHSYVSVVSGRPLAALRDLLGDCGVILSGNHGLEIAGGGISFRHPGAPEAAQRIESLVTRLRAELAHIPGNLVEDKGYGLTVHYRLVPFFRRGEVTAILRECWRELGQFAPNLTLFAAKEAWEIRACPAWGKGNAADFILGNTHGSHWEGRVRPVGIGDDQTDEDLFRFLRPRGAFTVNVGSGETAAAYRLRNSLEVLTLLESFRPAPARHLRSPT